jgi:hypothetical protein
VNKIQDKIVTYAVVIFIVVHEGKNKSKKEESAEDDQGIK